MNGLIIYKSKYGATAQYAEWLGEELGLPFHPAGHVNEQQLSKANYVLIGSSVYVGKLLIKKWLRRNADRLNHKKIFLFVVSGGATGDKEQQAAILHNNIPDILKNRTEVFFLPGRLSIERLSLKDKILLRVGSMLEKDQAKQKAMRHDIDGVDKARLSPVIKFVSLFTTAGIIIPNVTAEETYAGY